MEFDDSLSQEIGTKYPQVETNKPNGVEQVFTTPHQISSDTDKENSEVGSRSEACSHDSILNQVVNELKGLTTTVTEMDSSHKKMIEILIGLVKLEIKAPNIETNVVPDETTPPKPAAEAFTNINNPTRKSINVTNTYKTPYLGKQPILNDISTVYVSYDDDIPDTVGNDDVVRPYEHDMHYNKPTKPYKGPTTLVFDPEADDNSLNEITASKFFVGSSSYKRTKEHVNEPVMLPKKLSFTPSPCLGKRRKCDTPLGGSKGKSILSPPMSTIRSAKRPPRPHKFKPNMATLPKFMKCKFRPTIEMKLKVDQAKLIGYIFREDVEKKDEVVFAIGKDVGMRSDFQQLIPGGYVGLPIIKMMAMRVTWNQAHAISPCLWCLPPTFAREALSGYGTDKLEILYQKFYMPAFQTLKLIYIPMEDACGHWFLMVIHIEERKIYHLDSYLVVGQIDGRRQQIRKIAAVMSNMLLLIYNTEISFCSLPDFEQWEIVEPRGIPNCGHSENSGLWVAEWLNMQQSFNSQIIGVLEDRIVRTKMTLKLLTGPHNGCRQVLESKASEYYEMVSDANQD
ncbi:hypothetical protein P8452_58048 [Trifolium repens]|nr:hypothetical protein P8452_58048 [Trifolium repens]